MYIYHVYLFFVFSHTFISLIYKFIYEIIYLFSLCNYLSTSSDVIQCTGATLVDAVRADARSLDPTGNPNGDYYALHIRRGDFQYKVSVIMIIISI